MAQEDDALHKVIMFLKNHTAFSASRDLYECELLSAVVKTHEDLAAGRFVIEIPEEHMARLEAFQ